MLDQTNNNPPLTVWVDVAAELLGTTLPRAYSMIQSGDLPVLPGPGRKRVITARLETMCARRLTAGDIAAAEARLAPKRAKAKDACKKSHKGKAQRQASASAPINH